MHSDRYRLKPIASIAAALALMILTTANAHETWLLPSDFSPAVAEELGFTLTSGMDFPDGGSGIDAERIIDASLLQHNKTIPLVADGRDDKVLRLRATPMTGTACASVRLHPRVLEFGDDSVEHYLEEVGVPDEIWDAWQKTKGTTRWRESYSKLARSYLNVGGDASTADCWTKVSDARFDILPSSDPTALLPGDSLTINVFFDGKPLAGQSIGFIREGDRPEALRRSDDDGEVTFAIKGTGRHMIYATNLRQVQNEDFGWESDFTTLTFDVAER